MEREREKKRSRPEKVADGGGGSGGGQRKKERETKREEVVVPSPTEDEVEEFFAILRRMHVAVKYFEQSNGVGDGRKLMETLLATPLETEVSGQVDDDVMVCGKNGNAVLDLNTVPEGESSSFR